MATFGMTPVGGFPPTNADDFPNYIQFQENGTNLGGPDVDTVDFTGNVIATRGEGENAGTVTVSIGPMEWNEQPDDYTLVTGDAGRSVAMNSAGVNVVTIPADEQLAVDVGTSILVYQQGVGQTTIVPVSGVSLRVSSRLTASLADQYSVVSLIKRAENEWILTGDLEAF